LALDSALATLRTALDELTAPVVLVGLGVQLALLAAATGLAMVLRRLTCHWSDRLVERVDPRLRRPRLMAALRQAVTPALALLLIGVAHQISLALLGSAELLRIAASLLLAWIVIHTTSALVRDAAWARLIATATWLVVALHILHLLDPTVRLLDGMAISAGELRVSVYTLLKGALVAALLVWGALALARVSELRLQRLAGLTPSIQVLLAKLLRWGLLGIAVLFALTSVGINLTSFAVVGGAIGLGVGLGLQRIVSNLVSGVILLLDKSIKPGDVIQIGDTFGWITALNSRYVSLSGRDGHEYLIPNEQLITTQVTNWSYSSDHIRLEVPVSVGYDNDPHRVRALLLEAAARPVRVLKRPAPVCNLKTFGDYAIEFQLRFWIEDPKNGVANIKSEVLLAVWDILQGAGIQLPNPRLHDVRVTAAPPPAHAARDHAAE
jgi:small-conductance mechanosensitive channel